MTDDLTHVPPDVNTDPPPDPRGVKFVAGASQAVADWLRDYLGIDHPNDVARVQINLEVGAAATVDVVMYLRSGALAKFPPESITAVNVEPTEEQLQAASFALLQHGIRGDQAPDLARAVLKAAAPGPDGPR